LSAVREDVFCRWIRFPAVKQVLTMGKKSWKRHVFEWAGCQKAIGGIYLTKKVRSWDSKTWFTYWQFQTPTFLLSSHRQSTSMSGVVRQEANFWPIWPVSLRMQPWTRGKFRNLKCFNVHPQIDMRDCKYNCKHTTISPIKGYWRLAVL
jgi:hypothetical protein